MILSELQLDVTYRSDAGRIVTDFYVPCMMRSRLYRRAVGYFTSYGLAFAAQGVAHLLTNDGKIRLIASPQLSEEDTRAISLGYETRNEVVARVTSQTFKEIEDTLVKERLNALAWLISSDAMDIKLAIRVDSSGQLQRGIYHEKIGIFADDTGNSVAFAGSSNETIGGLIENFESIEVYWSWDDSQGRVARKIADFERLWDNNTKGLEVVNFNEATQELLEKFKTQDPPTIDPLEKKFALKIRKAIIGTPVFPDEIELRDYQLQAVGNWFKNNGRGTLEMATGSGKTITALTIASKLYEKIDLQALIIVCPFRHLVAQWERECRRFNLNSILAFESRTRWVDQLATTLYNVSAGNTPFVCVITTNSTFAGDAFQSKLRYFPRKTLLVADEVHNLGAKKLRECLPSNIGLRLGLSATPERWFDDRGTNALFEYFGPILEPEFTLKNALEQRVLVPYRYYPILVELTDVEKQEYLSLSAAIAKAAHFGDIDEDNPVLENLLIRRARLIAVAANKMDALRDLMRDRVAASHMLFYCGDGSVEDEATDEVMRQVDAVSHVLGYELGFRVSTYTAETELDDREDLRQRFDSGELQGLVAIRCLDEGVDIPTIRSVVILASSSNPRQFIQRRGRILRQSPGKTEADIFDMLVIPPTEGFISDAERKLVRKEIARFVEFADLAKNSGEARSRILEVQRRFGLLDM